MDDKQIRKINRYIEDLIDEKDELFKNIEKILVKISLQAKTLSTYPFTPSQKELVFKDVTKTLALICGLNHSVLAFMENEKPSNTSENLIDFQNSNNLEAISTLNNAINNCKVSNNEVQNNSLDEVICSNQASTIPNSSENVHTEMLLVIQENHCRNSPASPILSILTECEQSSSVTSTDQEQLKKFPVSPEISCQNNKHTYQNKDNTKKVDVNCDNDTSSLSLSFDYQETGTNKGKILSSKIIETPLEDITAEEPSTYNQSYTNKQYNEEQEQVVYKDKVEDAMGNCIQKPEVINNSSKTGAICRQQLSNRDVDYDKVQMWLNGAITGSVSWTESDSPFDEDLTDKNTATNKLTHRKRLDQNEEAQLHALSETPNLKMVPVAVHSDSSAETNKKSKKKNKRKYLKENGALELVQMDVPKPQEVCVFSHIISPDEFYLQIVNEVNNRHLDGIKESLNRAFKGTSSRFRTKKEASCSLGRFCSGYISDREDWFRLEVLNWNLDSSSENVEVQAVDYGFKYDIPYTNLREIIKADIPCLALKCHLALLYPPGSTYSNRLTVWPNTTIDCLHDIANLSYDSTTTEFKLFEIIFAKKYGVSVAVDLVQFDEDNKDSLGVILTSLQLAVEITNDYDSQPELGEFLGDINELEQAENVTEFVLGYDAKDEARVCQFSRKDGTCYKGANCKLNHAILKDGFTIDKTLSHHPSFDNRDIPSKGNLCQILVTAYIDSCTYLVQIIKNQFKKTNSNILMDKDLSDLIDSMNHQKMIAKYKCFKIYPSIGELIVAYHSGSKLWMRVIVDDFKHSVNGDNTLFEVYAVDFGSLFSVFLKDMRLMEEDFLHLPFQAVEVTLYNYQHNKNCDPVKAKKFFDKHIFQKNFLAHIKSDDRPCKVKITTFKGREIGLTLESEGFATKRTEDFIVSDNSKKILELT